MACQHPFETFSQRRFKGVVVLLRVCPDCKADLDAPEVDA